MSLVAKKKVPHAGPEGASLLILGDFPSSDEDYLGKPFQGKAGAYLDSMLQLARIDRSKIRLGNVLNYRPSDGDWKRAAGSSQLEESQMELYEYLNAHPPRVILVLGNEALEVVMGFGGISKWRGSVLQKGKSFVIPTYHPASALRDGTMGPQIVFDFQRAVKVLTTPWKAPVHNFYHEPLELDSFVPKLSSARFVTADIETIKGSRHILSIGFAWNATDALTLRNRAPFGSGQIDEQFRVGCERLFEAAQELTFHNGTFDVEQLEINQISVPREKYTWDTMFTQRILEPELPIGLDFCASIYTDEPYYKDEGKQVGKTIPLTLLPYNATDCIVTWQTRVAQESIMTESQKWSREQDHEDLCVVLDMQRNGMLVDQERLAQFRTAIEAKLKTDLTTLCLLAGRYVNPASPQDMQKLLYKELGLPVRKNKKGAVTTDEDAIVSLLQHAKREYETKKTETSQNEWLRKLGILKTLLAVRGHNKMLGSYINMTIPDDGRIRSSYNLAGTGTGRWSAGLYVDGTGFNSQTMPRADIEIQERF